MAADFEMPELLAPQTLAFRELMTKTDVPNNRRPREFRTVGLSEDRAPQHNGHCVFRCWDTPLVIHDYSLAWVTAQ